MSDRPQGPNVPVWVFVVVFAGVALLAGAVGWFAARSQPTLPVAGTASTPTVTVVTTPTVTTTTTVVTTTTVTTTTTPAPALVKNPALVTNVTWSAAKGYRITVDYVQILTGKAAADAATAAGAESPPPNDYFIVNTSTKLRTFSLPKSASVTVLGWGGADSTAKKKLAVGQFMDIMPGGASPQEPWMSAYYYVTVRSGTTVTKIEQIFFP
jgi:hypothetical protein